MSVFSLNSKIQKYSPSESAKVYDKAINRKTGVHFHPKQTLDFLRSDMAHSKITEEVKRSIVKQYLDVSRILTFFTKIIQKKFALVFSVVLNFECLEGRIGLLFLNCEILKILRSTKGP